VLIVDTTFSTSVCNANRWRTHFARTNNTTQKKKKKKKIYDNFSVTGKSEEKWLGDILSDGGLEKSAEATIANRYGRILSAIFELKAVIEDLRM
jgi:hypothetical protein